jgi:hypothetical protein
MEQQTLEFTDNDQAASVPEAEEVSYEEAKQEQSVPDPSPNSSPVEDIEDILVPKSEPKVWKIGPEGQEREYIQREMNFIQKVQWFGLLGSVLDDALSGENGLRINNLLSAPNRGGTLSMSDFRDADTFVQAVGKILSVAPDFLFKSFCIWLNVPDYERDYVMELMKLPEKDGGLSDDQGIGIIEVFIDQNYGSLDRFFREKLPGLAKRTQARAKEARESDR